jgi:hypothetical protein
MTLFFNLNKVMKEAKESPISVVRILNDMHTDNPITRLKRRLSGNSFLLKPEQLLNDKTTDILFIYQYILLAARRDYSHYKLFGEKSLPLSYFPDINLSSIRTNPLLKVTNTEITFKYEE